MAKKADGPSTARLGHGFRQAAKSGAPYIQPTSNRKLNKINDEKAYFNELAQPLKVLLDWFPDRGLESRIRKMLAERKTPKEIYDELSEELKDEWERKRRELKEEWKRKHRMGDW